MQTLHGHVLIQNISVSFAAREIKCALDAPRAETSLPQKLGSESPRWGETAGLVPSLPVLLTKFACIKHFRSQLEHVKNQQAAYSALHTISEVAVPNHVCWSANGKSSHKKTEHSHKNENPSPIQLPEPSFWQLNRGGGLGLHHAAPLPRTEHVAELLRLLRHADIAGGAVAVFGRDLAGGQTLDAERERLARAIGLGRANLPTGNQKLHPLVESVERAIVECASARVHERLAIGAVRSGETNTLGRVGEAEISCAYYATYYRDRKQVND